MGVDLERLNNLKLVRTQTISPRDTMLYALGVGLGGDPLDERQLRFVYEDGLQALPTMAITLAYPDLLGAYEASGLSINRILHGEQTFELSGLLPVSGTVVGDTRVVKLVDKGAAKGLVIYYRTEIRDADSGDRVATLTSSSFCLGDGGHGDAGMGGGPTLIDRHVLPDTPPEAVCNLVTLPQAALLYRLCGDYNPLHAVPALARSAGFEAPILHGRCTYGVVGHAILRIACMYQAERMRSMSARFTSPVYPGETIRTEMWPTPDGVLFRARVVERDVVVLDNGFARIAS